MNTLLANMKSALTGNATLSAYLGDDVAIRRWDPDELPDFDKYCVVLSPGAVSDQPHGMLGIEREMEVEIVCLVKYHGIEETLLGQTAPDGVGVHKLRDDVAAALRGNSLSGHIEADVDSVTGGGEPESVFEGSVMLMQAALRFRARRKIQTN